MQTPKSPTSADKVESIRRARLATVESLREGLLGSYLSPVPSDKTLHAWFKRARIPHFKPNPVATRGGGAIYYSVAAVERLIRQRAGIGTATTEGGGAA